VYLTNVEGVCRRFCDEKRARLVWAKDEALKFKDVWRQLSADDQRRLLSEKADVILKVKGGRGGRARWYILLLAGDATRECQEVQMLSSWRRVAEGDEHGDTTSCAQQGLRPGRAEFTDWKQG